MSEVPPIISSFPSATALENSAGQSSSFVPQSAPEKRRGFRWSRIPVFVWKLTLGMFGCLSVLGGILTLGWSYRLAQRAALKRWWRTARPKESRGRFEDFAGEDELTRPHAHWPNWILGPNFTERRRRASGEPLSAYLWRLIANSTESLRHNFWTGLQGIFNIWVFTLPGCVLWWFGWYQGWQNSFNKGYEYAFIGPAVSFLGIFAFIGAMYYVPMAQARQAVTGNWKSFYHFRLVWEVVRHRWLASLGLAALYFVLSFPVLVLRLGPFSDAKSIPAVESLTDAQALKTLNHYYFWCALYIFPAFLLVRVAAARIYASAIAEGLRNGWICHESLGLFEARALERLGLVYPRPASPRHPVLRAAFWAGTRLGRAMSYTALFFVWFAATVAQVYIAQFLKYLGAPAWLNQPLIQLPLFRYIPSRLENPLGPLAVAALVALAAGLIRSVYLKVSRRSKHNRLATALPAAATTER